MMEKRIRKSDLGDASAAKRDLAYWLSRPPAERLAAVEAYRKQYYGSLPRLQRVARVVQQTQG